MAVLLVVYLAFTLNYAWTLINDSSALVVAMGYALAVLPVVGAWALALELRFAVASSRLMKTLEAEGGMPHEEFSITPSGRADRAQAQKVFEDFAAAAQENPESWQAWLRLGLAYDASGDRRRARWAVRRAIGLSKGPQA
jgi:hypothetical protein